MKPSSKHRARVLSTPRPDVFATYSASGLHFSRHWHDVYGFGLLDRGAQSWASGRGRVDGYQGDVITTNPGEVHDGRPLGGPTRQWRIVSVPASIIDGEITHPVISDKSLAATLRRLFVSIESWNSGARTDTDSLAFETALAESCGLLMAKHGTLPERMTAARLDFRPIRDRLADAASKTPTLSELASMMGLSRFQLLRGFSRQFGLPPHAWLRSLRAERARALIRRGSTLAQAAAECGFSDQSHMTRIFARQYGCTPSAWARSQ